MQLHEADDVPPQNVSNNNFSEDSWSSGDVRYTFLMVQQALFQRCSWHGEAGVHVEQITAPLGLLVQQGLFQRLSSH
jgi:hypothetical protein